MTQEPLSQKGAKLPSVMRYERVQGILDNEPGLKERLGPKDQEIEKRNGEKHYYSRGVVAVTRMLHEQGFDAHNADKNTVLRLADEILQKFQKAPEKAPEKAKAQPEKVRPVAAEVPSEKVKAESKPKAARPSKVEAKPEPKAQLVVVPKPRTRRVNGSRQDKLASLPEAPALASPPEAVAPPAADKPGMVYYAYGICLSHAVTAFRLLEIGDRMPGAEERLKKASDLIEALKPLVSVSVPMPDDFNAALKNAKGSHTSPKT